MKELLFSEKTTAPSLINTYKIMLVYSDACCMHLTLHTFLPSATSAEEDRWEGTITRISASRIALLWRHALALSSFDLSHKWIRRQILAAHDRAVLNLVGCASWMKALCIAVAVPP